MGTLHLARMQNLPKNLHFLPPNTYTYVHVSRSKKYKFFGKSWGRNK